MKIHPVRADLFHADQHRQTLHDEVKSFFAILRRRIRREKRN